MFHRDIALPKYYQMGSPSNDLSPTAHSLSKIMHNINKSETFLDNKFTKAKTFCK